MSSDSKLQQIFAAHGIRPTYLVTYPVATSGASIDILGRYMSDGLCEIGTHLHTWNTPPVEEDRTPANSFLHQLPPSLQFRKLKTLHEAITQSFGAAPTSFRSGRWGFSEEVARILMRLRYRVDTSISPAIDWREYGGPDYSDISPEPYVYRAGNETSGLGDLLLEIPATVDFVQTPRGGASRAYRTIKAAMPPGSRSRVWIGYVS